MSGEQIWRGVTQTPSLTSERGQTFSVKGIRLVPPFLGTHLVSNLGDSSGTVVALVAQHGSQQYIWGTGFIIGPGVALTASHVIKEHFKEGHLKEEGSVLLAIGFRTDGSMRIWSCVHVTFVDGSDIAILSISAFSDFKSGDVVEILECTVVSPKVGEKVAVVGLTASQTSFAADATAGVSLVASKGEVLDLFETGRGSSYPGPCFAAAITGVGGMSGSPVVNETGIVIGMLSGSVAMPDNAGYSMISLLRAAMVHPFKGQWPPGLHKEGDDLRSTMGVFTHGLERIEVTEIAATNQKIIRYLTDP